MGIPKPKLDDLNFEQLIREAKTLISRYAPEWTDHNISDPGITLIELFAWLIETSLYRLNLITEKHFKKYLQLLGFKPQSARPAFIELTFEAKSEVKLDKGHLIWTKLDNKIFYFELLEEIKITSTNLKKVIVDEVCGIYDRTNQNEHPDLFFAPFGETTFDNACLYLGFDKSTDVINLFIELYEDDLIPPGAHGDEPYYDFQNAIFKWNFSINNDWQEITPSIDDTKGFKFSGRITFIIDSNKWQKKSLPFFDIGEYYWIRCSLEKSWLEYPPRIKNIRLNTIRAIQGRTIKEEEKFIATGLPAQNYQLKNSPVIKGSVKVSIKNELWEEKDDLYGSKPQDKHFMLDSKNGLLIFGDGLMGAVPPEGEEIIITEYRISDGAEGNLPSGLTWTSEGYEDLKIINLKPAYGGRDEETVEEARVRFLKDFEIPYRAVTLNDFEYIARNTPGLRIATTKAYIENSKIVVVIVPYTPLETFKKPPQPSNGMLKAICDHIDKHRLIGTWFEVRGPDYIQVEINAKIMIETGFEEINLKESILKALNNYLHPVKGGKDGKGWPIGDPVYLSEIYRTIQEVKGVKCILDLSLSADRGTIDEAGNLILPSKASVVYPGTHNILFVKEREDCRGYKSE